MPGQVCFIGRPAFINTKGHLNIMASKDKKGANGKTPASKPASSSAPANAEFPLFYSNPAPVDASTHGSLALKPDFGFGFTKEINAVPINMIEIPQVCHYYPIAFAPDESATPVAILGLRDKENLFVNNKGEWAQDAYIPAYIRRYPFIFSEVSGTDRLTLCVDMDDRFILKDGPQKFFEKDGTPAALSKNALEFCKSYHAAAQQSIIFSRELAASGLLVEREAQIVVGSGRINFSGFRIIDENKIATLDKETLFTWHRKGFLPFIYAHLFSGLQWQRLSRLLQERMK